MSFLNCIILTLMLGFGFGLNKILPKLGDKIDFSNYPSEFIAEHEFVTSTTMAVTERNAITQLYLDLEGKGTTTNSSNLLLKFYTQGTKVWCLCPSNNTTASSQGYLMEMITRKQFGEYVNFIPSDFAVNGVTGAVGKYFNSNTQPADFPQDYVGYYVWTHGSSGSSFPNAYGSTNASKDGVGFVRQTSFRLRGQINTPYQTSHITIPTINGFVGLSRSEPTLKRYYQNGNLIFDTNTGGFGTSILPIAQDLYFWANNLDGTSSNFWTSRMSFLISGTPGLNDDENLDLYEAVNNYRIAIGR
jgi:hypothetical protein